MVNPRMFRTGASRLVIAGVLAGVVLSGCKPNTQAAAPSAAPNPLAAIPLATSGAAPIAPAPAANALPAAPPARVGRLANDGDNYAFADQAYAMNSGFGDAPPDYTFDYDGGERPWVWRGDDQSMRVVEPLPDGGDRYYYYEPGADAPYLVRDPEYSYGYQNGILVVIYDHSGHALPPDALERRADVAGRFLARARAIYQASQQSQREAVAQANWTARRNEIDTERAQWAAAQAADQAWSAYHAAHEQDDQARWDAERYRREAEAARFDQSINDNQAAQQDWQAAQRAQVRAAATGQAQQQQPAKPSGLLGFGPKPPPAPSAPPPAAPPVLSPAPGPAPSGPPHFDHHEPGAAGGLHGGSSPANAPPVDTHPTFDHRPGEPGPTGPQGVVGHTPPAKPELGAPRLGTAPTHDHTPNSTPPRPVEPQFAHGSLAPGLNRVEPAHIAPPHAPTHAPPPTPPLAPHIVRPSPPLLPQPAPRVVKPPPPPVAHVVKPPPGPGDKHPERRPDQP